jgi:nickel-dependent lactate racemase
MSGSTTHAEVPWGAWFHEEARALPLDEGWSVETAAVGDGPLGPGLEEALDGPIGSPDVATLALGARSVAIGVEDITRPAAAGPVLDALLDRLAAAGIGPERVVVLIALGGHGALRRDELVMKLGPRVVETCDVWNHHPYEDLVDLGTSRGGIPIKINRLFYEADMRLAVGSVVPHPYAGFGGGGKIVLPGLAGIETLEMNHRPAVTGLSGAGLGVVDGNRAREEMEEIARRAGLQAVVNIVPGARRQPLAHFFGDPVEAHRRAVEHAQQVFRVPITPGADAAILNAYPKDAELLQVGNAFNAYRNVEPAPVREDGTVIVTAACPLGRGHHSLHGPRMRLYRDPIERPYLKGRELVVFAPTLSEADVRKSFWKGYPHAKSWDQVREILRRRHPHGGRMIVFETAPLAIPVPVGVEAKP